MLLYSNKWLLKSRGKIGTRRETWWGKPTSRSREITRSWHSAWAPWPIELLPRKWRESIRNWILTDIESSLKWQEPSRFKIRLLSAISRTYYRNFWSNNNLVFRRRRKRASTPISLIFQSCRVVLSTPSSPDWVRVRARAQGRRFQIIPRRPGRPRLTPIKMTVRRPMASRHHTGAPSDRSQPRREEVMTSRTSVSENSLTRLIKAPRRHTATRTANKLFRLSRKRSRNWLRS